MPQKLFHINFLIGIMLFPGIRIKKQWNIIHCENGNIKNNSDTRYLTQDRQVLTIQPLTHIWYYICRDCSPVRDIWYFYKFIWYLWYLWEASHRNFKKLCVVGMWYPSDIFSKNYPLCEIWHTFSKMYLILFEKIWDASGKIWQVHIK